MSQITFFVPGVPQPKGSAKAFFNKKLGRAMVVQDNKDKQKPWASMISYHTQQEMARPGFTPFGACCVSIEFVMPRPKKHFGSKGLKDSFSDARHTVKPDLDKLVRCVLDALVQGGAFPDDSLVTSVTASKDYGNTPGAHICVVERVGLGLVEMEV